MRVYSTGTILPYLHPLLLLCVWQVSCVAEFTPCLLQIVLDNVDLVVRQAGEWTCGLPNFYMYISTSIFISI